MKEEESTKRDLHHEYAEQGSVMVDATKEHPDTGTGQMVKRMLKVASEKKKIKKTTVCGQPVEPHGTFGYGVHSWGIGMKQREEIEKWKKEEKNKNERRRQN